MAIQTAFARDQGVFAYIKVNTSNTSEIKTKVLVVNTCI